MILHIFGRSGSSYVALNFPTLQQYPPVRQASGPGQTGCKPSVRPARRVGQTGRCLAVRPASWLGQTTDVDSNGVGFSLLRLYSFRRISSRHSY